MTRIDDVARLAGVSTATVSRALRGLPTVSAATRRRVLAAAEQLQYAVSPSASRLAGGRTGAIAVVVPRITRWFFGVVVEAVEDFLHQCGYDLLLHNLGGREQNRQRLLHPANLHKRVDGVMLVATPLRPADLTALTRLDLPGVTVSSGTDVPGWPCVRIDDVAAARLATRHLLDLGHRRIAHISGDPDDELAFTAHLDRRRGYQEALRAAGLRPDPTLDVESGFDIAGGTRATEELLRRGDPPTAIFAACDEMAMGALTALRDAGLRVPQDVSLIGIDDHALSGVLGLSTIAQPAAEQGRLAAEMLIDPLRGRTRAADCGANDLPVILPTRLVVRDSTAPPRAN
ncbi:MULTISPECIES: LacI family DNA-binding transcriptional regulator [Micromonospora]|uniref:LacI family transcriptional regulator n=1 Tax=Micromonospora maris TaxID=1003110 RepID=A0A9X0LDH5_9ACTN|nr:MULTISPECIES: LacI family DNA-binding transcriptional regulator [Micromonospora]AEB46925.1 transcriptional regulator, laci family protein [Micromonospora maris AB-18-032]KUJ46076.1 LacI family transcriptional regulator [Micromonospora maris]RUL90445.1 LacI family transcriptional regulator [Verrucosispora sp. FIM060022]